MEFPRFRGRVAAAVPFAAGIAVSCALIMQSTTAAFTGATSNGSNAFGAATVALTDDDSGSSMFDASDMVPGQSEQACIEVSYTGSAFTLEPVRLYSAVTDTGLAAHLDVQIEQGTGGDFSTCAGFSAGSTLFSGTLASLGTTHSSHATGLTAYTPTSGSSERTYRVTATLGNDTPNSAQGSGAGAAFTWEVHSN